MKTLKIMYTYANLPNRIITYNPYREKPIRLYGTIIFSHKSKSWLVIQKSYSNFYQAFMVGNYRKCNLNEMMKNFVKDELSVIRKIISKVLTFEDVFEGIFGDTKYDHGLEQFNNHKKQILVNLGRLKGQDKVDWMFVKGKKIYNEGDLETSVRECKEQTSIDTSVCSLVNLNPIVDNDKMVTEFSYEYRYFLFIVDEEKVFENKNTNINNILWISDATIANHIQIEKINVINECRRQIKLWCFKNLSE